MLSEVDLLSRVGPILSDGTPIRSLIDLERREISIRVLSDPEIHELELRRCFAKAWIPVGHVAELKNPGDYRLRYMGEDRVLVTKDADGGYNVLLNACAHRGMEICRSEEGNQASFKCPFHGWTFDSTGRLVGAPYEKLMYGDWDKSEYGLVTARVEVKSGVIFASFDENGPGLDEYLGEDMCWYMDFNLGDVDPEDMVVSSGPFGGQSFRIPANWKTLGEQNCGDGYHAITLHAGMSELFGTFAGSFAGSISIGTKNGHIIYTWDSQARLRGEPADYDIFSEGQGLSRVVFPIGHVGQGAVGGRSGKTVSVGGLIPKGPNAYEIWGVSVAPKTKALMRGLVETKAAMRGNVSGLILADDTQQGPSMQRSAQGFIARDRLTFKYNARYPGTEHRPEGFTAPGIVHAGVPRDDNQWKFWTHWFDVMTRDD